MSKKTITDAAWAHYGAKVLLQAPPIDAFHLSFRKEGTIVEEILKELEKDGYLTKITNIPCLSWGTTWMERSGLVERVEKGTYKLTEKRKKVRASKTENEIAYYLSKVHRAHSKEPKLAAAITPAPEIPRKSNSDKVDVTLNGVRTSGTVEDIARIIAAHTTVDLGKGKKKHLSWEPEF